MSRKEKLLQVLALGRKLCDDCLSDVSGIKPRQSVYQACTALRGEGLVSRMVESCETCHRMKIINALITTGQSLRRHESSVVKAQIDDVSLPDIEPTGGDKPWYWEGKVQDAIVLYLRKLNVSIHAEADTATRAQGKDIEAINPDGSILWVSVKGFPESSPNTQARHWFAGLLLDLALYREQDSTAKLALGLPRGFKTYETLVRRTHHTLKFYGCDVYWVSEGGDVYCEVVK